MKRGDVVTIVTSGDYGKPRPALIIQSDLFIDTASVTVLPLSSHLINAPLIRVGIDPDTKNGLHKQSQVMLDKLVTVTRSKVGSVLGCLKSSVMVEIERLLMVFIGIAS